MKKAARLRKTLKDARGKRFSRKEILEVVRDRNTGLKVKTERFYRFDGLRFLRPGEPEPQ